jgi:putative ATP-binding cassette transporter
MEQHRYLFSTIFTDFHLFDRFYGLSGVQPIQVQRLLELMALTYKVQYRDGRFSTRDLSGGQRKRLALITSLLEDKPIYLFDEWAAGQDPEFREYFYLTLLPQFQREGKTIVAITHDDQFFHVADRILKLDRGQLRPYEPPPDVQL